MQPETPQQFCLRWNNYQSNLTSVFDQLLQSESFVDVTLACDGHSIKAHKMVLSACSPYFKQLFVDNPCQHPIVILKDVNWPELKSMVEFMYKGEINVSQDQIGPLLKVAESLKIRGLADVNGEEDGAADGGGRSRKREAVGEERTGSASPLQLHKKRRRKCSPERKSISSPEISPGPGPGEGGDPPPELGVALGPQHPPAPPPHHPDVVPPCSLPQPPPPLPVDDLEIKPGIAEMIREEERAKLLESSHGWLGASTSTLAADSYQYQLQSMWQKCWNTNQSLVHNLRFRERGPLKSWRPETMAEAIFSVLKEGLSLSQAARKYDIPYPTFVLYANRVHNMLGPSADGGADLRPKGRGRPQRILLGVWPDEHIRGVIRAVVFRDPQHIKEEPTMPYPRIPESQYMGNSCGPPADPSTAAIAAVAHGLRQQMCNMVAAAHHHDGSLVNSLNLLSHCNTLGIPSNGMRMSSPQDLRVNSPVTREINISPETSPRTAVEGGAVNLSTHVSPLVAGAKDSGDKQTADDYELNLSTRHLPHLSKSPSEVYGDLEDLVPPDTSMVPRDTPMPLKVEISE